MRRRVRKFQGGGMDASKSDFKSPSSRTYSRSYNPGAGGVVQHGSVDKGSQSQSGGGGGQQKITKGKDDPEGLKNLKVSKAPGVGPVSMLLNIAAKPRQKGLEKNIAYFEGLKSRGRLDKYALSPAGYTRYMKDRLGGKITASGNPMAIGKSDDGMPPLQKGPMMAAKPATSSTPIGRKKVAPYDMGFNFKKGGLSGGKRFGPPPKKGPDPHGKCPFRPDGIRGVGAVEPGRGVKFVGVK